MTRAYSGWCRRHAATMACNPAVLLAALVPLVLLAGGNYELHRHWGGFMTFVAGIAAAVICAVAGLLLLGVMAIISSAAPDVQLPESVEDIKASMDELREQMNQRAAQAAPSREELLEQLAADHVKPWSRQDPEPGRSMSEEADALADGSLEVDVAGGNVLEFRKAKP